ncbi:hypothetical protein JXA32_08445 [Candidatus Sumerlaeota bacterium]|nr:hypothetical protein [Candidatus Sumerlaeota bacterium]
MTFANATQLQEHFNQLCGGVANRLSRRDIEDVMEENGIRLQDVDEKHQIWDLLYAACLRTGVD